MVSRKVEETLSYIVSKSETFLFNRNLLCTYFLKMELWSLVVEEIYSLNTL